VAHDLDVGLEPEQRGERAGDELLVLGDDDADQRAAPVASGSVTTSRVPWSIVRTSEPPCDSTRSRIPVKPRPSLGEPPTPSS
jgi:hypothetical protein